MSTLTEDVVTVTTNCYCVSTKVVILLRNRNNKQQFRQRKDAKTPFLIN
jgi:hypothetical protein